MKKTNVLTTLTAMLLTAAMLFALACASVENPTESPEPTAAVDPTADAPTSESPFNDGRAVMAGLLWVVIKDEYHDHIYTGKEFPEIENNIMSNDIYFSQELALDCTSYRMWLPEQTCEAVLEACELLSLREEVELAMPEYMPDGYTGADFVSFKVSVEIKQEYLDHLYTADDFSELEIRAVRHGYDGLDFPEEEILAHPFYEILLPYHSKQAVLDICELLMKRDDVELAEPSYYGEYFAVPNDALYSTQWALSKISMPNAWNMTTGSSAVKVGIIDSGITTDHPDLKNRINTSLSKNFDGVSTDISDAAGHGTKVAGIIGAQGNNTAGICGVNWNVSLVVLKISQNPTLDANIIAEAIVYAKSKGIKLLNMSFGVAPNSNLATAINQYNGLIVCAAGNSGKNLDGPVTIYPAQYTSDKIIVVGASKQNDQRLGSSNYGKQTVDLFAPGSSIMTTDSSGNYSQYSGSSFAAPFVTGVAALILALHPNATAAQIKEAILDSVDSVPALNELCLTGGRLNAYKALTHHSVHNCNYTAINDLTHKAECSICQRTMTLPHKFEPHGTAHICIHCGRIVQTRNTDADEKE